MRAGQRALLERAFMSHSTLPWPHMECRTYLSNEQRAMNNGAISFHEVKYSIQRALRHLFSHTSTQQLERPTSSGQNALAAPVPLWRGTHTPTISQLRQLYRLNPTHLAAPHLAHERDSTHANVHSIHGFASTKVVAEKLHSTGQRALRALMTLAF